MADKRRAFVHVGLDDRRGDVVARGLDRHAHALLELGVKNPAKTREEMLCAGLDLMGSAREWRYEPDEVDGAWERVCHRAGKGRDTVALSQPLLAAADADVAARVAQGLRSLEMHVVVTAHAPDAWTSPENRAQDLSAVLDAWSPVVGKPTRIHVVIGTSPDETWSALGRVVGFGTASLKVDDGSASRAATWTRPHGQEPTGSAEQLRDLGASWCELLMSSDHDLVGDPEDLVPDLETLHTPSPAVTERRLGEALCEVELLRLRNESLERRLAQVEKKRAKLKRRLSEAS